jgi:hypothetical protein
MMGVGIYRLLAVLQGDLLPVWPIYTPPAVPDCHDNNLQRPRSWTASCCAKDGAWRRVPAATPRS